MILRQVALVAGELDPVRSQIFSLLGLDDDFADPGVGEFGLHNSVMAIGNTFLEVVSPKQPGTTAGRLLERRGGDGGYMVLVQVEDIDHYREHTESLGIRKVWNIDRDIVKAFHVHPRDIGAAIVSYDQMIPPESWEWGGPGWEARGSKFVDDITAVDLQGADPEALARRWSEAFERPLHRDGDKFVIALDKGTVYVMEDQDGRGDGVCGVEFSVRDKAAIERAAESLELPFEGNQVEVCGTIFRFRF